MTGVGRRSSAGSPDTDCLGRDIRRCAGSRRDSRRLRGLSPRAGIDDAFTDSLQPAQRATHRQAKPPTSPFTAGAGAICRRLSHEGLDSTADRHDMARKTLRRILLLPLACCFPLTLDASTQTYEYAYDDAGRLTEVRTEASVIDYDYDDAGNIIGR